MATTRKKGIVKELQGLFKESQVLIFTDYRGLSVADITSLRRQLREKGVEFHVTKNTLSNLAATRTGMEAMSAMLDGPTAIAFVGDDIPGAAKVLADFVRTSRILQIRGGLAGSIVLNPEQVADLTKVLRREEYVAKLLGSMQSPISSMMNVMNGTLRGFMNVMQARIEQLKEGGDTAGVEAEAEAVGGSEDAATSDTGGEGEPAPEASGGSEVASTPEAMGGSEPAPEASGGGEVAAIADVAPTGEETASTDVAPTGEEAAGTNTSVSADVGGETTEATTTETEAAPEAAGDTSSTPTEG